MYDHNENHFRVPGSWPCPCLASLPSLPPTAPFTSSLRSSFRQGGTISDNDLKRVLSHFSVKTIFFLVQGPQSWVGSLFNGSQGRWEQNTPVQNMIVVFKILIIINQPARPDRRDPLSVREHAQRRVGACSQPHLRRTRGPW